MTSKKRVAIAGALLGAFSISAQFTLTMSRVSEKTELTYLGEFFRYWGYMTIWTNTMVTLIWFASVIRAKNPLLNFLRSASLRTGAALFIAIVGFVYHWLLSLSTFRTPLDHYNDIIFHTAIPILYVFWWLFLDEKSILSYKSAAKWMIYPAVYAIFTVIKGLITLKYPYPFLDVTVLGWNPVLLNGLGFALMYGFLGALWIALNNFLAEKNTPKGAK